MMLEREVFPVCLRANGRDIWLAWEMTESPDCFWRDQRGVLWADDRSGVLAGIADVDGTARIGMDEHFDMDAALRSLRVSGSVDPEEMNDIWNLMTDLSRAVTGRPEPFRPDLSDAYDAYFSNCGAAEMVGLSQSVVSAQDLTAAIDVLEDGLSLLARVTNQREARAAD